MLDPANIVEKVKIRIRKFNEGESEPYEVVEEEFTRDEIEQLTVKKEERDASN